MIARLVADHELHCELGGCRHPHNHDACCALCRYVATALEHGRGRASDWLELSLDEMAELDRRLDARYGRGWRRRGIDNDRDTLGT